MEPTDYLVPLRTEGEAFLRAAGDVPRARVPSCPDWEVADLLGHLGLLHHWVSGMLTTGAVSRPGRELPADVGADWSLARDWFAQGVGDLVDVLADADPDMPVWNFVDDRPAPAAFWFRRMAHETSVHRVDAELAATAAGGERPHPVALELAADGIDETVLLATARLRRTPVATLDGALGLSPTDGGPDRTLLLAPDHLVLVPGTAEARAVVRATTSTLHLWLLQRHDPDEAAPVIEGDAAVAASWSGVRF